MNTSSSSNFSENLHDPSTVLQRPTSAKTPDVTHILTSIFGLVSSLSLIFYTFSSSIKFCFIFFSPHIFSEIFTKDILSTDVIKNLTVSSDVDDHYHKRYVQKLKEAQLIKENRVQEYAMLEKHILEARAKALAYEERENEKRSRVCDDPDRLGVPSAKSYFSRCCDDTLLKEHNLLVPSDYYYRIKQPHVPLPRGEFPASHLKSTMSSRSRSHLSSFNKLPSINSTTKVPCIDDIEELHKAGSVEENESEIESVSSNEEDYDAADKKSKKKKWKDLVRQEDRVGYKQALKNFERRTKFLPNPRLESMRLAPTFVFLFLSPSFYLFQVKLFF